MLDLASAVPFRDLSDGSSQTAAFSERSALTDAGVGRLARFANAPRMTHLAPSSPKRNLPLETLTLRSPAVADDAVPELAAIPSLRDLWLDGTSVTPTG